MIPQDLKAIFFRQSARRAGPRTVLAALVCAAVVQVAVAWPAAAAAAAAPSSAMVIDANSGKVLYSTAADQQRFPASLTKMMTLYLAFELIERGRLKFTDRIAISAQAASQAPSKLELQPGETIQVRDAVLALVTKSANDVAVGLAEHIGGSEANFARLMTSKARAIGMSKTTFRNASGLPNDEQVTTARDMLTLALRLQDDFPQHYKLFATKSFEFKGDTHRNHNTLLNHYQGTDGIKTGYTRASGFNLVSSVRRDGKHLVAVVFGGKTAGQRNAQMRAILDRSFAKAETRRTRARQPQLIAAPKPVEPPARVAQAPAKPTPAPRPPRPSAVKASMDTAPNNTASNDTTRADEASKATVSKDSPGNDTASKAATADEAPATDQTSESPSRIAIAKVRRIGVAEHLARRRAARAAATASATPAPQSQSGTPQTLAELIAATASAPSDNKPSALGMQVDGAITPAPSAATPVGLASRPAPEPEAGRSPSTLQEQLSGILASNRPAALKESASSKATTASEMPATQSNGNPQAAAAGTHYVQIGAFGSEVEAQRKLDAVRARAAKLLSRAAPVTESYTKGERRYFRARFAGFDASSATTVCQELRRQSIDCFVSRTP